MIIPKLHYISQGKTAAEHLENIRKACAEGIELVQLRLKNYDETTILNVARIAREITSSYQTKLIINDYFKVAATIKADGVHLGKTDTCPDIAREYLEDWQIIGGTANTLDDCNSLINKKINYIGLGPFQFTTTKDNLSPVLGSQGYRVICQSLNSPIPIIAIGGITLNDVPSILETGVYGIAVSGEITKNFNNVSKLRELLTDSGLMEKI
ncbi:thiamine phosphate synthase [Marinigracilibium pacificum]|uniref:Thiamine-phosphate synthase n=1 Tax=Marinigracilibium pacificum TaxID=2729599 RepID=A0A848J0D5_9BACT|nr:thiamine phosphate synthase [Marinigracilibium pacificum]NMM47729.1 thiamine phosphate synthase [Marinigracilibium pacificum]